MVCLLVLAIASGRGRADVIVVNTLEDELNSDGDCSCREALIAANTDQPFDGCPAGAGPDTITFADGLEGGTLRLTIVGPQSVLQITDNLAILGRNVTIDGQGAAQMFRISPPQVPANQSIMVVFRDLRMTRARGGAIFATTGPRGDLIVRNCVLNGNNPGQAVQAAAISHLLGATTTVENCEIADNNGAGVVSGARSEIVNCRLSGNAGYAVANQVSTLQSLTVRDTQIRYNGGGIFVLPTGTPQPETLVRVENTTIETNGSPTTSLSAGIYVTQAGVTLSNVTVRGNQSIGGGAGVLLASTLPEHRATIHRSKFLENVDHPGGAFGGGGVALTMSALIEDTTIDRNSSRTKLPSANVGGGGLGFWPNGPNQTLTLRRCTISGNFCEERGGGLFVGGSSNLRMENCTVSANLGAKAGSAISSDFLRTATLLNNTIHLNGIGGVPVSLRTVTGTNHTLANNIIIGNHVNPGGTELDTLTPFAGGRNIIGSGSTGRDGTDLVGVDPGLLQLADNGGHTETHALDVISRARDAGDNSYALRLGTDQRGRGRIAGAAVDIGSFEDSGGGPPPPGSIKGLVWEDVDGDGTHDAGERGLAGIRLWLYRDNGSRPDAVDEDDAQMATRTTDASGEFEFDSLEPAAYLVFSDPLSWPAIAVPTGGVNPHAVALAPGQKVEDVRFGYQARGGTIEAGAILHLGVIAAPIEDAAISLYRDANENGAWEAADPLIATQETGANSRTLFEGLGTGKYLVILLPSSVPDLCFDQQDRYAVDISGGSLQGSGVPASRVRLDPFVFKLYTIEGYVFFDFNADGLATAPGLDLPLKNVAVTQYRDANKNGQLDAADVRMAIDTTDPGGMFRFWGSGDEDYLLEIDRATLPAGVSLLTTANLPFAIRGQNLSLLSIACVFETGGFGFTSAPTWPSGGGAVLADFVWHDLDEDGLQSTGEPGVPGVRVVLRDGDNTRDLAATKTDLGGLYAFTGLAPGTYRVLFTNLPPGMAFTARDTGLDDARDSDPDRTTGLTEPIVLGAGERELDVDAGLTGSRTLDLSSAFSGLALENGVLRLSWLAKAGLRYQLQGSATPAGPWRPVGAPILGTGVEVSETLPLGRDASQGYFRIVSLAP